MKLALVLLPFTNERLQIARQIGVTDIVTVLPQEDRNGPVWDFQAILRHRKQIEDAGLKWSVVESVPISDRIKLGLEGRDLDIKYYCQNIRNLGAAGIPIMCWNWMAVFGWMRTSMTTRTRGEALSSSYDHTLMEDAPLTEHGEIGEDRLWETLDYFLKRIIPVAEEAGVKQSLHPDDPPLSPIRGIPRIVTSIQNYDRILNLFPSEFNGLTFCQGNFKAMGADIPDSIRHFGTHIHFSHFRDLKGKVPSFEETFHDAGETDMAACIRAYKEIGFSGPIRPDHVPVLAGEANDTPGYTLMARLYAVGYMKGLIDGVS